MTAGLRAGRGRRVGAMTDIFISYARTDRPRIEKLAAALHRAGYSVWWDKHLSPGTHFTQETEAILNDAKVVIVAWSQTSVGSMWVADEATVGRDRSVLVPIAIDRVDPPIGFRQIQTLPLAGWNGDERAEAFIELVSAIGARLNGEAGPPAPPDRRRISVKPAIAIAAAIALAGVSIGLFAANRPGQPAGEAPQAVASSSMRDIAATDPSSVAVLPFADLSPQKDQGYFSDGVAEEILNALVRVDGLRVASRTSSFQFKEQQEVGVPAIARELNVRHVLDGSVRKAGDRVRITAQLIDAVADRNLWSETFDRTLTAESVFEIQSEIATAVVASLRSTLGAAPPEPVRIDPTTSNLSAYDLNLQSRALFMTRRPENIDKAIELSEQAVATDPTFAKGWEQLGAVYAVAASYGLRGRDYPKLANEANERALSIDDTLSTPYAVAGLTYRAQYPTPWALSIESLEKALARDDKNTDALLWLGMDYIALGYFDKAIEALSKCLDIDAAYANCRKNRIVALIASGREDAAYAEIGPIIESGFLRDADVYIGPLLKKGERMTALFISGEINSFDGFPHAKFVDALANPEKVEPREFAELKAWAEKSGADILHRSHILLAFHAYEELTLERFGNAYENLWLPVYAPYRKTAAFRKLVADLGHVDYWRKEGFPPQCRTLPNGDFECA